MTSTHRLRTVPVRILARGLYSDLIILDMPDYDVILRMNFSNKYGTSIEYRKRRVVFQPRTDVKFDFIGEPKKGNFYKV